jgi:nucleotide-binding universal stress UspA family protein
MTPVISIRPQDERPADVVVGVDGSGPSVRALIWALRLADQRDWTVEVVTAWPGADSVHVHDVPGHFSAPRQRAFAAQGAALTQARETVGNGSAARALVVNAHPVEALAARGASARLLVTGSHADRRRPPGHRGRASIGQSLALLVRCPVVVVHDARTRHQATTPPVTSSPRRSRPPDDEPGTMVPPSPTWWVELSLDEADGLSTATATLHTRRRTGLSSEGTARLNPGDRDVPTIGLELAAARALSSLADRLVEASAGARRGAEQQPVPPSHARKVS